MKAFDVCKRTNLSTNVHVFRFKNSRKNKRLPHLNLD